MDKQLLTKQIKEKAKSLGFMACGVAKAEYMDEEAKNLEAWLEQGMHGSMNYMENHFELRVNPSLLVPGAKSVICLMYNYYPEKELDSRFKIARYAYGRDYHKVIKKKLKYFMQWMQENIGQIEGRCFVDSAPVLERDWAKRAGLGWTGKNTLLLNKESGSYFFLAEIISDLELVYDERVQDHCGTCTRCIEACPTDAISKNGYVLDGSKCISYLTIELKSAISEKFKGKMNDWIFGCDICQEVCPWNRFSTPHTEDDFLASQALHGMTEDKWLAMNEEVFDHLFKGSAVKRTKFGGLKKNIGFITKDEA